MNDQKKGFVIDTALLTEIFNAVVTIGQAVITYGPIVIQGLENIYNDLHLAYQSVSAGEPQTPEQLAAIRTNLDRANQAAANAAAAAEAEDANDPPVDPPAPQPDPAPTPDPDQPPAPDSPPEPDPNAPPAPQPDDEG